MNLGPLFPTCKGPSARHGTLDSVFQQTVLAAGRLVFRPEDVESRASPRPVYNDGKLISTAWAKRTFDEPLGLAKRRPLLELVQFGLRSLGPHQNAEQSSLYTS